MKPFVQIYGIDQSLHTSQLYYKSNCLNIFDIHEFKVGLYMHSWSTNKHPFVLKNCFSCQYGIRPFKIQPIFQVIGSANRKIMFYFLVKKYGMKCLLT